MIKTVVLDVDDTLYLERDYVRSGFEQVGTWAKAMFGTAAVSDVAWNLFESGVRRTTLTDALTACGVSVTPEVRAGAIAVYREHKPSIALAQDVQLFIDRYRTSTQWAVITDGPSASQRAKCEALGLLDLAVPVVVTEEHGSSKPDPEMFAIVERSRRHSSNGFVYVADNPLKDFAGPLARGWCCVRVRRSGSLHELVPTPDGVPELTDFDGLDDVLGFSC